jgi:hypothetical protein
VLQVRRLKMETEFLLQADEQVKQGDGVGPSRDCHQNTVSAGKHAVPADCRFDLGLEIVHTANFARFPDPKQQGRIETGRVL